MIKKHYKALIDGMIFSIIFFLLGEYTFSVVFELKTSYIIVSICLIVSVISGVYNHRYNSFGDLIVGYLLSFVSGIVFLCIIYLLLFGISFLPTSLVFDQRELVDADGLLFIIYEGIYLFGYIVFKLILFVVQIINILCKRRLRKL